MDLATAEQNLADWLAADTATQGGQSYSIDGLSIQRTDADMITRKINLWQKIVNEIKDVDSGRPSGVRVASWS